MDMDGRRRDGVEFLWTLQWWFEYIPGNWLHFSDYGTENTEVDFNLNDLSIRLSGINVNVMNLHMDTAAQEKQ